jgi:homoserine kinase type II
MAVYTHVPQAELEEFLGRFALGALVSFEGIEQGVENTNYHVFTKQGRFILTLFEKRTERADLPYFFAFTDHLSKTGIACPAAIAARDGEIIGALCGRPAVLVNFLSGAGAVNADITPAHCREVGAAAAHMHMAALDFPMTRVNAMSLPAWRELADRTAGQADTVETGLGGKIEHELSYLSQNWPCALPSAAVHADMFPDNVFFENGRFAGVIDFYFTANDFLAYDLALIINAWCFDAQWRFSQARYDALLSAYEDLRPLEAAERGALPVLCRGAALRILITRLHDWIFRDPDAVVIPKDPREYSAILDFHQKGGLCAPVKTECAAL